MRLVDDDRERTAAVLAATDSRTVTGLIGTLRIAIRLTDGTLTFPYLGRVPVAGLTLEDLQSRLTSLLKAGYIRNPQVRVEVEGYKSQSIIVSGEVRQPGKIMMTGTIRRMGSSWSFRLTSPPSMPGMM